MARFRVYPLIQVGDVFGRLTVVAPADPVANRAGHKRPRWECLCQCGSQKPFLDIMLKNGNTKSCGCNKAGNRTHGWSAGENKPLYYIWRAMIARCTNPNIKKYHLYGGAGIRVCPEWMEDFPQFMKDMGPRPSSRHSIERRYSTKNYEPTNCYWGTYTQQNQNTSRNVYMEFRGETLCLTEIARRNNIGPTTLRTRLERGMSLEEALITPVGRWAVPRKPTPHGPNGRFA